MLTEDRDPLGLPIPWYWVVCLCISGLSVICGIIACICLDRHMKKKLLAYLNEHQELQSVTSEDEVKAVSAKKLSSELEKVSKQQNKKTTNSSTNGKVPESSLFRKQKSKQELIEPISYTSLMGNYFEADASLEADSETDKSSVQSTKELKKPPVRLEPLEVRPVPPREVPVKQLKKRGQGLSSTNPKPLMLAALAATTFDSMKTGNTEYEEMKTTTTNRDESLNAEVAETTLTDVVSAGSSSPAISMSPVSSRKRFIEVTESPVSQRKNMIEVSEKAKNDDGDTRRPVKSCVEGVGSERWDRGNVNAGYSPGSEQIPTRNAASEEIYTDFSSSSDEDENDKKN